MNEHIEHWKRYSNAYMRWVRFEFDRIVEDAINNDIKAEAKRKEEIEKEKFKNSLLGKILAIQKDYLNKYAEEVMKDNVFMSGSQWGQWGANASSLRIKLPADYVAKG